MMTKTKLLIAALLFGVLLNSCSNDDDGPAVAIIELETIGLKALTGGTSYQGWIIVNGQPVGTTKFTNPTGVVRLEVFASDLTSATQFILTVEPVGDIDNKPSDTKILTGNFNSNSAQLSFLPVVADLSDTSGQFFLATPTDNAGGVDNGNDEFGVWFMNGATTPGLSLPTLSNGWKYEGWVDFGTQTLSTGTFSNVSGVDDGNFFKGSGGTVPEFPGEDFLVLPTQVPITGITLPAAVTSKRVFITVEPVGDGDPAPFFIEPLSAIAGITTGSGNPITMLSNTVVPSGIVKRPN